MKKIALLVLSLVAAVTVSNAQVCALKTNALTFVAGGINLGAEFSVAPQWTIDLAGTAQVLNYADNVFQVNGWSAIAEGRYYLCRAFNGHHFGAFAQANRFGSGHVEALGLGKNQNIIGAGLGVSYGYYFKLNTYWGIDTNVGVAAYAAYSNTRKAAGLGLKWLPMPRAQVSLSYKF